MLSSFLPGSDAKLWELLIDLNVQKGSIYSEKNVVITCKAVDHSYKPISEAEVLIRTVTYTTKAFTDPHGMFRGKFKHFQKIPGTYTVNVIASRYGMTGLTSTVLGKRRLSPESGLEEKLSSEEAQKYHSAEESGFERNSEDFKNSICYA